jgi:hypothetical protein
MSDTDTLREARNSLLKLHKMLLDDERFSYEKQHGLLSPTEYLQVLLEDTDFAWLRQFSILIVEIDEMFAGKAGYSDELVAANLRKIADLCDLRTFDNDFKTKYRRALDSNVEIAELNEAIKRSITEAGV